jgi:hypothetical protein
MPRDNEPAHEPILTLDRKIGVQWLLTIIGAIGLSAFNMYVSVKALTLTVSQVQASVVQIQATIATRDTRVSSIANDVDFLKFRLGKVEFEQEKINALMIEKGSKK